MATSRGGKDVTSSDDSGETTIIVNPAYPSSAPLSSSPSSEPSIHSTLAPPPLSCDFPTDAPTDRDNQRRIVGSSIIGNMLEWYDFVLYVYLESVISTIFFPPSNVYTRLIAFYGIFAAGFVTRPLGAIIFGHIGDKFGRKNALMLSIFLMSLPTALMGCLPTYAQVGVAAPLLLALIRCLQGLAVGGEFTGTIVFLVESAGSGHRGLQGSWAFASDMLGVILGSLVATLFISCLPSAALYSWGWRVPFLLSLLGSAVGLYLRYYIQDVPVHTTSKDDDPHHSMPLVKTVRQHWRPMLMVLLLDMVGGIGYYTVGVFLPTYFTEVLQFSKTNSLIINTANMVMYMLLVPLGGMMSDRFGRRITLLLPCAGALTLTYPIWLLFTMRSVAAAFAAQCMLCAMLAMYAGGLAVVFVDLFPPDVRCTGLSVAHNLCMMLFGGTAPLVASGMMEITHDITAPSAQLIIGAAFSLLGVMLLHKFGIR